MNSQTSNQNCMYSNPDKCDCSRIPDDCLTADTNHTREETFEASNDSLEEEVIDLKVQLENLQETIEDIEKRHIQCYSNLTGDYDGLLINYKQVENNILEVQKYNGDLQNTKHSKTQKEVQMVKEIEELKFFIDRNIECNEILQKKNHEEKLCVESLKQQLSDVVNVISCKTTEVDQSRCKLADEEKAICCENIELQEMRRRNDEDDQTVVELKSACRKLEAKLEALKETGPVKLAAANESAEAARAELADACSMEVDWRAKCERAEEEHRELQANVGEEKSRAQATLSDLCRERDRLTDQLSETSSALAAARCKSQQLLASVKAKTGQLDVMKAERERLRRGACQGRSQLAVLQAKIDVETKQIENQKTVNRQRLLTIENEIGALKQASNQREQIIENARNELDGDGCSANRLVQRSLI